MKEQSVKNRARDAVLVVCGVMSFVLLFWVLNVYVIPWARDHISDHYGATYFRSVGPSEFSFIEGAFCILLGIASLVRGYFINVYIWTAWSDLKARMRSTPSILTGISLIIAGIVLIGLHYFAWM